MIRSRGILIVKKSNYTKSTKKHSVTKRIFSVISIVGFPLSVFDMIYGTVIREIMDEGGIPVLRLARTGKEVDVIRRESAFDYDSKIS